MVILTVIVPTSFFVSNTFQVGACSKHMGCVLHILGLQLVVWVGWCEGCGGMQERGVQAEQRAGG